jgi:hypothetical protein
MFAMGGQSGVNARLVPRVVEGKLFLALGLSLLSFVFLGVFSNCSSYALRLPTVAGSSLPKVGLWLALRFVSW